jgi:hypothetical protein
MIAGLAAPAASGAEAPSEARGSESFEVIVVRGAGVSLATGTQSGVIREEVLREDPRPARRAPKPPARAPQADRQLTVIYYGAPAATAGYLFVGDRFDRNGFRGHGRNGFRGHGRIKQHHGVWTGIRSSQKVHHVRSHGRGGHGGRGGRPGGWSY